MKIKISYSTKENLVKDKRKKARGRSSQIYDFGAVTGANVEHNSMRKGGRRAKAIRAPKTKAECEFQKVKTIRNGQWKNHKLLSSNYYG